MDGGGGGDEASTPELEMSRQSDSTSGGRVERKRRGQYARER